MIKKISSFLIIMTFLFACSSGDFVDSEDTKTRIVDATNAMFNAQTSMETMIRSLVEFLDVVIDLNSTSKYKDEIKHHLDVAKDLIQNTSLFNDKARQYMSFAYRMITNGQKFQRPKELDEFVTPSEAQEKGIKYSKGLIDKALAELKSGSKKEASRLLLEFVLLTVTPIPG